VTGADNTGTGAGTAADEPANPELTISGGGSTMVATDVVFAQVATLRLLQAEAEEWREQISRVQAEDPGMVLTRHSGDLGACVLAAFVAIIHVADSSRELADSLVEAAERYGRLETSLDSALGSAGSWLAHTLGVLRPLAPLAALSLATPLAYLAATSLVSNAVLGRGTSVVPPALADWLEQNPTALTSPVTVALVRVLVSSADDAALGGLGVPYPVAAALGDDGAGLLGAPSSALGVLVAARAAGMLRETAVRVHRVGGSAGPVAGTGVGRETGRETGRQPSMAGIAAGPTATLHRPSPPAGFADLADRIPTEADGGQVRIERYGDPEHPSWLVYLGGTIEWSPTGSTEPWDMTSNLTAVAGQEAGSYRAVVQALHAAGVQPGDPVVPVAHSQGGLLAAELAARDDLNTVGMVTFGAPAGQVAVPAGLPAIAIEHTDDIIPALGGPAADGDRRLYVRRELFAGIDVPQDAALPAHQLVGYRETASLVDASAEPRLMAFRERLGGIVGTAPGEQSVWRAERVQ
jgi:hypothetical protein